MAQIAIGSTHKVIKTVDIKPIRTQRDYERALCEIESLMTAKRNTPEGDRLDVLVTLVEAWEIKHYPLCRPGPNESWIKMKWGGAAKTARTDDIEPFASNGNRDPPS